MVIIILMTKRKIFMIKKDVPFN
ncbi:uncharacterized protein METZ01_LOCUS315151, partial [marine metagenome]